MDKPNHMQGEHQKGHEDPSREMNREHDGLEKARMETQQEDWKEKQEEKQEKEDFLEKE